MEVLGADSVMCALCVCNFLGSTDAFFENVCELDLVFNFYKACISLSYFLNKCNLTAFLAHRFTQSSMKYSLLARSRRRVKKSFFPDLTNWRNWSDDRIHYMYYDIKDTRWQLYQY